MFIHNNFFRCYILFLMCSPPYYIRLCFYLKTEDVAENEYMTVSDAHADHQMMDIQNKVYEETQTQDIKTM